MAQVAKGAKDSLTEVIRSGDLIAYTAEEGVRYLGEVPSCLLIERVHVCPTHVCTGAASLADMVCEQQLTLIPDDAGHAAGQRFLPWAGPHKAMHGLQGAPQALLHNAPPPGQQSQVALVPFSC